MSPSAASPSFSAPIPAVAATQAPVLTPAQLIAATHRRYSTKQFDPTRDIPADAWAALEESLLYAASSVGLQPWRFLVITDRAFRERVLLPHSFKQRPVVDASHLVVFLARTDLGLADIDRWLKRVGEIRPTTQESLDAQRQRIRGFLVDAPPSGFDAGQFAVQQVHLALGSFITAAALLGLDTLPIGGFDPAAYDRELELAGSGYRSVVLAAVGYRSDQDRNATQPKVRFPREEVIIHHPGGR